MLKWEKVKLSAYDDLFAKGYYFGFEIRKGIAVDNQKGNFSGGFFLYKLIEEEYTYIGYFRKLKTAKHVAELINGETKNDKLR